jgi:hypothetical protein
MRIVEPKGYPMVSMENGVILIANHFTSQTGAKT